MLPSNRGCFLYYPQRYALSWFDSLIVAAAIETGCETLLTEDMQDGLVVDGTLTIVNPFRSS